MKRREFVALVGGSAITWPFFSYAQESKSVLPKRVGILTHFPCPTELLPSTMRRLTELGWIEGKTFVFECVSALDRLDQLQALAHELVSRRPDVLVAPAILFVKALKDETTTIPIVMGTAPEPVRLGLIASFARPGGNVTGVAWFGIDLLPKRIEYLTEIVPHLRKLAIIRSVYVEPQTKEILEEKLTIGARTLGYAFEHFQAVVASDYDEILARIVRERFDAAYIAPDPFTVQNRARIIELALHHRMPTVGEASDYAKLGCLFSYGQDLDWTGVRIAEYIDKMLRGAKPSELPVEQAIKFELVINLKTAKTLGLTIPSTLLAQADAVIE